MLDCSRDGPEELEEHSMVAYKVVDQDYIVHILTFYFPLYSAIKCHRYYVLKYYAQKAFLLMQFWM